uniref:Uncharacterized protein n=1 Tax=uncultured prokaryote TaxID=198431 RepID=A0A0H5Q3E4_9ZZZZ|nr:hypothetical protein [uncultured prokaryote]
MTTLTFRLRVEEAKETFRSWCVAMVALGILGEFWGWVQEFQERGVVHYHVLHTLQDLLSVYEPCEVRFETVRRKKKLTDVLRGTAGADIAETWIRTVNDPSLEFHRFQRGGITEKFRNPAAMGYYFGRYVAKAAQKTLPDSEPPQGGWWWTSPASKPKIGPEEIVTVWPFERPHHFLFDSSVIKQAKDSVPEGNSAK